jgi:hypothetical protein
LQIFQWWLLGLLGFPIFYLCRNDAIKNESLIFVM